MFMALVLHSDRHFQFSGGVMAIRVRGRRRSLSKKVSSFNMYDDQVYQIRAIMESSGEYKDAPVIRQLLDEALRARRLKALGYADDAPPGQSASETLHSLHDLLVKVHKHTHGLLQNQNVMIMLMLEILIAAQESRDTAFNVLVKDPWLQKGKTAETVQNYYDMKTRDARAKGNELLERFKKMVASKSGA
jgi:hypothetical protein